MEKAINELTQEIERLEQENIELQKETSIAKIIEMQIEKNRLLIEEMSKSITRIKYLIYIRDKC